MANQKSSYLEMLNAMKSMSPQDTRAIQQLLEKRANWAAQPSQTLSGRGTLEKEKPPIFGMIQRGGEVVIRMLANVQQLTIEPLLKATLLLPVEFTPMSTVSIALWRVGLPTQNRLS